MLGASGTRGVADLILPDGIARMSSAQGEQPAGEKAPGFKAPADKAPVDRKAERARRASLNATRDADRAALKAEQKQSTQERLAYLMRQTDIFVHFIKPDEAGSSSAAGAGASSGGTGRRTKGRMTEDAEDKLMLQAAENEGQAGGSGARGGGVRLTAQPACIANGEMRAYQLEGLNWLLKLHEHKINGILADEMGLGKTLQTISLLGYLKQAGTAGPHLVIAPKATLTNWYKEVERWCPSLKAFKLHGDKRARDRLRGEYLDKPGSFDVCITTYEVVIQEKGVLSKIVWKYLVIDEASSPTPAVIDITPLVICMPL